MLRPQAGRSDIGYRFFGRATLLVTCVEDRGTVAHAAVVALAVQCRRIVDLEEKLEQVPISRLVGVEDDLDRLSVGAMIRSEEHTSELQSLMRISYAVFCLKKKKKQINIQSKIMKNETQTSGKDYIKTKPHIEITEEDNNNEAIQIRY